MNKLFLTFTGLCEFVPRYPLEEHPGKNEMRVLLANSRHLPIPHPAPHEDHLARLVCPYDSVDRSGGNRTHDDEFWDDGRRWAVFFLDDQDLFLGSNRKQLKIQLSKDAECPNLDDLDNRCSFRWVGPLKLISPDSEVVKNGCFLRDFPDESVISRVALTEGSIASHTIAADDGKIIRWRFKEPPDGREERSRRALADSVLYEMSFSSEVAKLTTRLFRDATNRRVRDIYPNGPGSRLVISLLLESNEVHASVKNMPEPDIEGTREPRPRSPIDHHFAHVYELSKTVNKFNVPHQAGRCSGEPLKPCGLGMGLIEKFSRLHRGNPNCPPALAAAHPDEPDENAWKFD